MLQISETTRTIGALVSAVGAGGGLISAWRLWRGQRSRYWRTVPGWVEVSSVDQVDTSTGHGSTTRYEPTITFAYRVGDAEFRSSRWSFAPAPQSYEEARTLAAQYPQGASVTVHYNPRWPAEAVLEPGASRQTGLMLALYLAALGIGAYLACGT